MADNKYLHILNYLEEYGGEQYKRLERCRNAEERSFMEKGSWEGRTARSAFTDLVQLLENRTGFKAERISQWQNSGTFVSYLWCQLKKTVALDSNISLSLFAEKNNGASRFRVSVELAVEHASIEEKGAYRRILDIPLDHGLVYVSGGNNESEFRILSESNNEVVKQMQLRKVQVSFVLDKSRCSEETYIENELMNGATKLIRYYDLAIDQEPTEEDESKMQVTVKDAIDRIKSYIISNLIVRRH